MAGGAQAAIPYGKPIHGEIISVDLDPGVELVFTDEDVATVNVGSDERLALILAILQSPGGGDSTLFFDNDGLAAALAIDDADAVANTFGVAGDLTNEFRVGRVFVVANSTGNDATYTSTAVSYDVGTDETTISVASVASGVDDGDITSTPTHTAGNAILVFDNSSANAEMPEGIWPPEAARVGPLAYTVYAETAVAIDRSQAIVDGFIRKTITKTGPLLPQGGQT